MEHIWIIDPYSELPKPGWRSGRYEQMAGKLAEAGYMCTMFVSNFSHRLKEFSNEPEKVKISDGFTVVQVPTNRYDSHISMKRIKYEQDFASGIASNVHDLPLPSLILLKEPAVFMFKNLQPLFKKSRAKLIIDIIDLWPELFVIKIPPVFRFLGKFMFSSLYQRRKKIFKAANGLIAVAPDYLELGLNANPIVPGETIYWGSNYHQIQEAMKQADKSSFKQLGLSEKSSDTWGIYAGTLGENYDVQTLLDASNAMEKTHPQLKFIIAGSGPMEQKVRDAAAKNKNIIFVGSLQTDMLYKLFAFCDFGFSTYSKGSTVSMPIKCYDYMAAGLPLINSLQRNLGKLVENQKLGFQYSASDKDSLVKVLTMIMKDKSVLVEAKEQCINVGAQFDEEIQYRKLISVVKKVLNSNTASN